VYYAAYASAHGIPLAAAENLLACVFTVIAASIVVHGVSATPLMSLHRRRGTQTPEAPPPLSDKG
jgi:NhaP-type Na+/H+ or K+/H+ antiporter